MSFNILVTGGAGFIGSHTCKALASAGYLPVTYDNLSTGHRWAVKWGPLEVGNCSDPVRLDEVIRKYNPSMVIHFAGSAYVGESMTNPAKYYFNNVYATSVLLESMKRNDIGRIVFSSTCATYGIPSVLPIPDDCIQRPINTYGKTKLYVEQMLVDFARAYDIQHVILRYFNASGADPSGEIGEEHDPEPHLIPIALQVAAGKRPYMEIYGDDWSTPDGTCIRDYVHVNDLADAHLCSLKYLSTSGKNLVCNIGTGKGSSVSEIVNAAKRITGKNIIVQCSPRREGDPAELFCSSANAQVHLGWRPRYTDIAEHIEHAWQWITNLDKK